MTAPKPVAEFASEYEEAIRAAKEEGGREALSNLTGWVEVNKAGDAIIVLHDDKEKAGRKGPARVNLLRLFDRDEGNDNDVITSEIIRRVIDLLDAAYRERKEEETIDRIEEINEEINTAIEMRGSVAVQKKHEFDAVITGLYAELGEAVISA